MANSPSQIQISHVIFDFDGILVDTERLYTVANERSLEKFGGKFTIELKAMMMGRKKEEAVKILIEAAGLNGKITCDEYMVEYDKNIEEITTQQTEALPGADKLLGHFFDNKIPLAICTGSDHLEFKYKTAKFPHWVQMIPEQLRLLCGSDPDVTEGKPSPQPYQIVLRRFKAIYASAPDPAQVLVFEDSINGVKSAVAAGCTVIMVPQPDQLPQNWREHLPKDPNLVAILDSLHHFKPEEFGLPSFGNDEENGKMMN